MMNLSVFASGRGSNFLAIAKAVKAGRLKANLTLLICDNPKAAVLDKARRLKINAVLVNRKDFSSKKDFEARIISLLKENKIDLIVMAGYMRIISPEFVAAYKNRIINIHPALLPSFKGAEGIKDAFFHGVRYTGVTVHFVTEEMDDGPIILQSPVEIKKTDTLRSLEEKIHKIEHRIYPEAIKLIIEGKVKINDRRVKIKAA
jgi:phosphoribosylglycinamide formyltransferase-1